MAEISGNFYKLVEKRLENIEKEVKSTQDTVRVITDRAEEYGRRCELVSNRLEDLSEGMHTLNDTVDCLSEGLIALPSMIEPANAFSGCKSVSSSLINTYVTEFQSIYNEHVKRAMRKRLDHSFSSQSGVNSHGQRSISDIEGHARDSVRRRLGLNEEELRRLESFKLLSTDGEDAFAGKLDPNNNSLILDKASTNFKYELSRLYSCRAEFITGAFIYQSDWKASLVQIPLTISSTK